MKKDIDTFSKLLKRQGQRNSGVLSLLVLALLVARDAHAYFDPASGSVIVQVLVGIAVGIAMTVKLFWAKIMLFFRTLFGGKNTSPADDE